MEKDIIRKAVREGYARVVKKPSCCGNSVSSCCGPGTSPREVSKIIGYTEDEIKSIPAEADLGLGCGNPTALASLREGETVLDLGAGGGLDCFLASNKVGLGGWVIGVDMTPEMVETARENATKHKYNNVEFRLGEIENLPVADNSVDVIISNCVINLSIDKKRVFQEAFRVLKPGGRMMISDIVILGELPEVIRNSVEGYIGCVSGAESKTDYLSLIKAAGFSNIDIIQDSSFSLNCIISAPELSKSIEKLGISGTSLGELARNIRSITVSAVKQTGNT